MTEIFSGTFSEAMNIRNLLEHENVEVFTINENMANIETVAISAGGYNSVRLNVNDQDAEKANKIITGFNNGELSL